MSSLPYQFPDGLACQPGLPRKKKTFPAHEKKRERKNQQKGNTKTAHGSTASPGCRRLKQLALRASVVKLVLVEPRRQAVHVTKRSISPVMPFFSEKREGIEGRTVRCISGHMRIEHCGMCPGLLLVLSSCYLNQGLPT